MILVVLTLLIRFIQGTYLGAAPLGNAETEEREENAQDENEDDGPFALEALSDSEEEKNPDQVPVTGRRFKETLREEKPPRAQVGNSRKRRPGEVDSGFVLSKLTPECLVKEQRQFCCKKTCVWNLGINKLRSERKRYFRLSRTERAVYLESLVTKLDKGGVVFRLSQNLTVCRKAFKIIFCVGNSRLQRLRLPDKHPASIDTVARQPSAEAFILLEWLDSFFLSHCERQPADGKYHLPNNFTKKEVYDHYRTDMVQVRECLQYSSFKHYWVKFYPFVTIPTTNKFSVCDFCELYKSKRDKGVTSLEKAEAVEALKLHRKQQPEERAAAGRRHWKALDSPKDCAYIQIDGMDQKKTALPHFSKQPKSVDGAALVGVHLVGAMIFHGILRTRAFLTYNNLKSDSNLTITVLQKNLLEWEGILPPTLYLQLDNIVRENKNNILFAYLAMLLEKKVFTKIKLGFLLVGHTHDFVDQMFSPFSQALRRENVFTMSRLRSVIENSYDPKHVTTILTQTWDFKHFIETEPKLFRTLNDITQNQQYKFKVAPALEVRVWWKQFSTDNTWEPPAGVRDILHIDGSRAILASEQVPLKSYAEIKRQTRRVQNIGPLVGRQEGEAEFNLQHHRYLRKMVQFISYSFIELADLDQLEYSALCRMNLVNYVTRIQRLCVADDVFWWSMFNTDADGERLLVRGLNGATCMIGWHEIHVAFGAVHDQRDEFRAIKIAHKQFAGYKPSEYLPETIETNVNKKLVSGQPYEEINYYKEAAPYGSTYYLNDSYCRALLV
ncbi:hypothetical protein R1sor_013489 [Riccia sorocarpa]|uniref:DUF7869 domain-containing protein n=1 Tax=Riccia sorocarpa TaxID=122646 RepID=A0ABD3H6Q1_9MARC